MCYDLKPGTLKSGQADGLQPRTLEVLKSLDVADEILNHGCHMSEVAFWNPKSSTPAGARAGIERTSFAPDVVVASRYKHEVTIHQGRIERILEDNLDQYATGCIQRSTRLVDFCLDAASDAEYPLKIELEQETAEGWKIRKTVRSKYLVGADGAHSQVRKSMGLNLIGETTDHIWGVVDFVADTTFPDVRKRCAIHSDAGSIMIIPRERISTGQYFDSIIRTDQGRDIRRRLGSKQPNITGEKSQSASRDHARLYYGTSATCASPYTISIKKDTEVDWWAAYQIGQRMTSSFSMSDDNGHSRAFIVGDGEFCLVPE